ncbi:MAG: hypothetical protein ACE5J3_11245, partial [Methanosarcinales archaeon]
VAYKKRSIAFMRLKGMFSTLVRMPSLIRHRRYVQKKIRKVEDKKIMKFMDRRSLELSRFLKGYGKFILR